MRIYWGKSGFLATQSSFISLASLVWVKSHTSGTPSHALYFASGRYGKNEGEADGRNKDVIDCRAGEWRMKVVAPDGGQDHLPDYKYDPLLSGNNSVTITNCNIDYAPDPARRDTKACGIVVDRKFNGNLGMPEDVTITYCKISGFPTGIQFGDGTSGNKIRDTIINCQQSVDDRGQNSIKLLPTSSHHQDQ